MKTYQLTKERLLISKSEKISETIICTICKNILLNPHTCDECLNTFCQICITKITKEKKTCVCGQNEEKIKKAPKLILDMLSKKRFFCYNKKEGCEKILEYEKIQNHEKTCEFRLVNCKNKNCQILKKTSEISKHENSCEFNIITCKFCKNKIIQKQKKTHEQNCDESIKICHGCKSQIKKKILQKHIENCQKIKIKCQHCEILYLRPQYNKHNSIQCLKNLIYDYDSISIKKIRNLKNEIEGVLDKLTKNEAFLKNNCSHCNKFGCSANLEKCFLCKVFFCSHCAKGVLKNCGDCKMRFCGECLEFSESKGKCFLCDDKEKKVFCSSSLFCRRYGPLEERKGEEGIVRYKAEI